MRTATLLFLIVTALASSAHAQLHAGWNLLESPYAASQGSYAVGESVICSVSFPSTASMFGADQVTGSSSPAVLFATELFAPFRLWEFDEGCTPTATWSTLFAGTTMTGVAMPSGNTATYWAIDPSASVAVGYDYGIGTATGATIPLSSFGYIGGFVINDNAGGEEGCYLDIISDTVTCVDMSAAGAFVCSFATPDTPNAFGQGLTDSILPDAGSDLIVATGTMSEGSPVRASLAGCSFGGSGCETSIWGFGKLPPGTWIAGICEFDRGGSRTLLAIDNTNQIGYLLANPSGTSACVTPPLSIQAWWTLDEGSGTAAADYHGCSDGNHTGAPTILAAKVDNGLSFSGSNQVDVPHAACLNFGPGQFAFNSSSMSVEAWVRTTSTGTQSIVKKIGTAPVNGFDLFLKGGMLHFTMDIKKIPGAPTARGTFAGSTDIADGNWHHVAATLNRGGIQAGRLYIDGQLELSFTALVGTIDSTEDLIIGEGFVGEIDEVALYGAALTECEVLQVFKADTNGKCK